MKTSIPRIRNVRFKSGGSLTLFPNTGTSCRVDIGWGEVFFRVYDENHRPLTVSDISYMADRAKEEVAYESD
jgi:hypothetical protein